VLMGGLLNVVFQISKESVSGLPVSYNITRIYRLIDPMNMLPLLGSVKG
jgi:hypothetical protein